MATYDIQLLPFDRDIETKTVLKRAASARAKLAELKGVAETIPNQSILIDTLSLQEARQSSAIENIITTNDELFRSASADSEFSSKEAKEVLQYRSALLRGYEKVKSSGILREQDIHEMQSVLVGSDAGFRKLPGTALKNAATQETVYLPPSPERIGALMSNLVLFLNDDRLCDWDPLVKMAVLHHQFESIHPYYDGNGRTGRILNILFLVKEELLAIPILYLSRYINHLKGDYYRLLQAVRDHQEWEAWIIFMLHGVEQTSDYTIQQIREIKQLMINAKHKIKEESPKIYSQDLINNIFRHPYTKIDFLTRDLDVTRITATKYLDELIRMGILLKVKMGRENYYINQELFRVIERGVNFEFSYSHDPKNP